MPKETKDVEFDRLVNDGRLYFDNIRCYTSEGVRLAITVLRDELLRHGDLYDGFIASINSAIDDMTRNKCDSNMQPAEYILQRIIGED